MNQPTAVHKATSPVVEPRSHTAAVSLRPMRPQDVVSCGQIGFEAHGTVAAAHNVPSEQPSVEYAVGMIQQLLAQPGSVALVAEREGQIAGSIFLHTFGSVGVIGPLTVRPQDEGGIGGRLLQEALAEAQSRGLRAVRLVQSPAHLRSLALYTKMGFDVQEPLVLMHGQLPTDTAAPTRVRLATAADLADCNALCRRVHGLERATELQNALQQGSATVAERGDDLVGYAAGLGLMGHAVARSTDDLKALIAAAPAIYGPGFFVPTRNGELFRWLLRAGMRAMWSANLMSLGPYQVPNGAFLPSIAF